MDDPQDSKRSKRTRKQASSKRKKSKGAPAQSQDSQLPVAGEEESKPGDLANPLAGALNGNHSSQTGAGGKLGLPPDGMILLCVRGMALFPGVVLPIAIGRERSVLAVQAAVEQDLPLGVVLQRDAELQTPKPEDLFEMGTVAEIVRYITAPDGSHHIIAQGKQRFRIIEFLGSEPFLTARVEQILEPAQDKQLDMETQARFLNLKNQAREALQLLPQTPEDLDQAIQNSSVPSKLTDMVATFMDLPPDEKQDLLETTDLEQRMLKVSKKLAHLVEVLQLSSKIRQETTGTLEKAQREYYLREQLKTIQKELGESGAGELALLSEQLESAGMPEPVLAVAIKEMRRLEGMPEAAAETSMLRTYLEWLAELPWNKSSQDALDIAKARAILDEDHYGLSKVKRRILEFMAVRSLNPTGKSPILCLVGPPGVGKTSLGQSIARATGREFVRLSLGGVHDESEIRGHRRTYVGAMPGNIIQSIKKAGTNNPVFMLDEMDKLGQSFQGDPSAALLEVLDPEQNRTFRDHYLNVPFDLSRVLFISTANVMESIPGPLRDRCEVIELSGYTEDEKLQIARRYLVRRQLEANGLKRSQASINTSALREIIRHFTRESGCRALERNIGSVLRNVATRIVEGTIKRASITPEDLPAILGQPLFESEVALRTKTPGVATGLVWTPVGGGILFLEATGFPGKGELILTGQLGDVMRESARTAISLVKARAEALGIDPAYFSSNDIHIHVPAGAIPKDGPSAGVALLSALVSLLTGKPVRPDLAMTGEISLRGLVLPVGGVKEKVIGAHRAGIRTICLPKRNMRDLEDVPEGAKAKLQFIPTENIDDVLAVAFRKPKPSPSSRRKSSRKSSRKKAKKKTSRKSSKKARRKKV